MGSEQWAGAHAGLCSRGKELGFAQNASRWRLLKTGQGWLLSSRPEVRVASLRLVASGEK